MRPVTTAIKLVAAVVVVASCSDASPQAAQGPGDSTIAAPTTAVGESEPSNEPSTTVTPADASLPPLDDLPPLSPSDPDFEETEACRAVEALYRYRSALSVVAEGTSLDEVTAVTSTHAALLEAVAATELSDEVPDLGDAAAIERAYAERLTGRWGTDGAELFTEAAGSGTTVYRLLLDEPVVVDGRTVSQSSTDAADLQETVDDLLVLACTEAPDGWAPPADDPSLEPPGLPFIAATDRADWFLVGLDEPSGSDVVLSGYGSIDPSQENDRFIGVTSPDRNLVLIDPLDWSTVPVPGAGTGWGCATWTVDGSAILGDLVDPDTGERTPVRLDLGSGNPPEPLPDVVESCPKSIGPVEVVTGGDETLYGVTFDGSQRELLSLDRCNLVPITGARDGLLDVYANCTNPYLDGLHQLDVDTGEVSHLIAGLVGAGAVSLDGRWRLFGHVPHGGPVSDPVLWVLDQETGRTVSLDGLRAYFPVFVPS